MGLFSSEKKYYAHVGSSDLIPEDQRENTVLSLMLQGVISGDSTAAESVTIGLQTNMYARARSMWKYAGKEYFYGFPETDQTLSAASEELLVETLEAEIGEPINEIRRYIVGTADESFFLAKRITETYLDPDYWPWPAGNPTKLTWEFDQETTEIPVINPDTSAYYEVVNTAGYVRVQDSALYQVYFPYENTSGEYDRWFVQSVYDLSEWVGKNLIQVIYTTESDPDTYKFYVYEIGSNVNPELEASIKTVDVYLQYLPIILLLRDKIWFDEADEAEDDLLEVTTDKICKRLAIDPYEIKEDYIASVEEAIENGERPGTKKLDDWDFFIHFAAPIHSQIRGTREYLFEFFRNLIPSVSSFEDYQSWLTTGTSGSQPQFEITIQEGGINGFNVAYRFTYVFEVTHEGIYTIPYDVQHPDRPGVGDELLPGRMHSQVFEFKKTLGTDYTAGLTEVHGSDIAYGGDKGYHDYAVFTKQNIDKNNPSYTQVLVMAPSMEYKINTKSDGGFRFRYVDVELFPEDPEEVSEFKIPIHIGSLRAVSTMHREEALQDSLCATVYLVEKVKIKWYQKSFFKWLIVIITIIVVILAWQYELLPTIAGLATAAAGTTAALGLWALYVVVTFAIGFLISFSGSLIGGKWGMVFVLVASLILAGVNPFTKLTGAWHNIATTPSWGSAFSFIQTVSPYVKVAMSFYQDYALAKLESDMRDFTATAKEKYEELQNAWDTLGPMPSWLDPMDLIAAMDRWYVETPDNYYARVLNANPGVLGYDLINNFNELALQLPENGNDSDIIKAMFNEFEKQRGAA